MKNKQYLVKFLSSSTSILILSGLLPTDLLAQPNASPAMNNRSPAQVNVDDSKHFRDADGSWIEIQADGTKIIKKRDGTAVQMKPDGTTMIHDADGSMIHVRPDGSKVIRKTDGTHVEVKAASQNLS